MPLQGECWGTEGSGDDTKVNDADDAKDAELTVKAKKPAAEGKPKKNPLTLKGAALRAATGEKLGVIKKQSQTKLLYGHAKTLQEQAKSKDVTKKPKPMTAAEKSDPPGKRVITERPITQHGITLLENMGQALMTMTTVEDNNTVSDTDDSENENGENTVTI